MWLQLDQQGGVLVELGGFVAGPFVRFRRCGFLRHLENIVDLRDSGCPKPVRCRVACTCGDEWRGNEVGRRPLGMRLRRYVIDKTVYPMCMHDNGHYPVTQRDPTRASKHLNSMTSVNFFFFSNVFSPSLVLCTLNYHVYANFAGTR